MIASCSLVKTGLSIGKRTETSSSEPAIQTPSQQTKTGRPQRRALPLTFLTLPEMRLSAVQVYLARMRSACEEVSQSQPPERLPSEKRATNLAVRSKSNFEEELDVGRDDVGVRSGEHAQDDDRASALEARDVLVRAFAKKGTSAFPNNDPGREEEPTVDAPEFRDGLVGNVALGHHDSKQLLERDEFGERRVPRQSGQRAEHQWIGPRRQKRREEDGTHSMTFLATRLIWSFSERSATGSK